MRGGHASAATLGVPCLPCSEGAVRPAAPRLDDGKLRPGQTVQALAGTIRHPP